MADGRKGDKQSFEEVKEAIKEYGKIDYVVVTHIDTDHINGILKIFKLPLTDAVRRAFEHAVIIYNYVTKPVIIYPQAAEFENLLQKHAVISTVKKNYRRYFSPCLKILSYDQRKNFDPKEQEGFLEGDYAVLTFLGPDKDGVEKVYRDYRKHPAKASLELVNRNSIAFLLEYGERAALFTGDGMMKDIADKAEQLKNMQRDGIYRKIDVVKMAHHGAKDNNTGLADFVKHHGTRELFVTGCEQWNGKHPSKEILSELNSMADGCQLQYQITFHTHTDLPWAEELDHLKFESGDMLIWEDAK